MLMGLLGYRLFHNYLLALGIGALLRSFSVAMKEVYLCNGEKSCSSSCGCYKNGGECRHTADAGYALNKAEDRRMVWLDDDHLWEDETIPF